MKKIVFGIFAHPDDEAFLTAGSFLTWVNEGADLHLICATRGERGQNPDHVVDLGKLREHEWEEAAALLGASSYTQLGYPDGGLQNNLFHEITDRLNAIVTAKLDTYHTPYEVRFVTYENCGITGHLDHIAMSFMTTYSFARLKDAHPNIELLYACACEAVSPQSDVSFVFMPKGHDHGHIDVTIDVSDVLERKKQIMRAHHSQRDDAEAIIARLGNNLAYEHFNRFTG